MHVLVASPLHQPALGDCGWVGKGDNLFFSTHQKTPEDNPRGFAKHLVVNKLTMQTLKTVSLEDGDRIQLYI
jgi:hypothetical protein